jgi:hypothetical protein
MQSPESLSKRMRRAGRPVAKRAGRGGCRVFSNGQQFPRGGARGMLPPVVGISEKGTFSDENEEYPSLSGMEPVPPIYNRRDSPMVPD